MNKTTLTCLLIMALAVMLFVTGQFKGKPTYVESVFLQGIDHVEHAGDYSESGESPLEKVAMFARHELTEENRSMESGEPASAVNEALLSERLSELGGLVSAAGREMRVAEQRGESPDPLKGLVVVVETELDARARGYTIGFFVVLFMGAAPLIFRALNPARRTRERMIHGAFFLTASISIVVLFLIMIFLFIEGLPVFKFVPPMDFLFGDEWYPTEEPPALEIFPLIIASGAVTAVSSVIAVPLGVMTAVYLAEIAPAKVRGFCKPMVEMLAALPSVVIGFFGMVVVAPFLQDAFGIPTGLNLFNASVMLAFMSVPTITSISEDAIYSVPVELKEASLALGATHWQSICKVIIPASLSGITTAVILGMARAVGETMVVLMVAGGAAMIPTSLFDPVRPMPASIAAEMAEAPFHSEHYHALFGIGMVLFLFTMLFNVVADIAAHKFKQTGAATL